MNNHFLLLLKNMIDYTKSYYPCNAEILRNIVKEEIHYYILNFIYHHHKYCNWIMYGGSVLRICYELNRMSVDLDFEISEICTKDYLNKFKSDIENHFYNTYLSQDKLKIKVSGKRGIMLKFIICKDLGIEHKSNQIRVRIDLNNFYNKNFVTQKIPINHNQLSFSIQTYNISTLMASKIAAVLLRKDRIVGRNIYDEKGRDIYDLIWYMEQKIIPNIGYLNKKKLQIIDINTLFKKLTTKLEKVNFTNLQNDLLPLFLEKTYIINWLNQWYESYLRLLNNYNIYKIQSLHSILIKENLRDDYYFYYIYVTEKGDKVSIEYSVSWEFINQINNDFNINIKTDISKLIKYNIQTKNKNLEKYVYIFLNKNNNYFKKNNHIIFGNNIKTKKICYSANNSHIKDKINLDKNMFLSIDLESLLL